MDTNGKHYEKFLPFLSQIGIVVRTRAGKSYLITCLFRLAELQEQIRIDGHDITTLTDVRKKIAIIPQVCPGGGDLLYNGVWRCAFISLSSLKMGAF